MKKSKYLKAVKDCLRWTEKVMLTFDRGYWGVYERIRIDQNERVCHCRPDCSSELARVLQSYRETAGDERYNDVYENQIHWLQRVQNGEDKTNAGSFPFAMADGTRKYYEISITFPNDNGKVILNLLLLYEKTGNKDLLRMAVAAADYWAGIQREDGSFYDENNKQFMHSEHRGACFVLWMMAAMYRCYRAAGEEKYLACGRKAFGLVRGWIRGGRMLTTMETDSDEFWRPVSSENAIALYCFASAYECDFDAALLDCCKEIWPFTEGLIDACGAVRNCDENTLAASENNDQWLCDFVYTEGYALNAFIKLYTVTKEKRYLRRAEKLADWIVSVQCRGENDNWNGAWRGAYHLKEKRWAGRCNQRNEYLDEGGEFSVYTGWSAYPICIGLLDLVQIENQ